VPPSNPLDDLLEVVDRLTQTHKSTVVVEADDGAESTVTIEHDALIKQLRGLVSSSTGSTVAGAGLPSERNVLDFDALELYQQVTAKCRGLFESVSAATPFPNPESNLRHWYMEVRRQFEGKKISETTLHGKHKQLAKLVGLIENKINPPTVLEITAPCPRCNSTHGLDDHGVYRRAVIVESRITQYRSLDHTRALCVVCRATWLHGRGMRQLRYEIDVQEDSRHAESQNMLTIEQVFGNYDTMGVRSTSVPEFETRP
jgi:hypothetical protein